jgi:hypothetical protein
MTGSAGNFTDPVLLPRHATGQKDGRGIAIGN